MTISRLKSLRRRTWGPKDEPNMQDIGESLRDMHGFMEQLTLCSVIPVVKALWAEPFSFALSQRPQMLILGDARLAGTLTSVDAGALDWQVEQKSNGLRAVINRCKTLTPGTQYDLKFLAVY